MEDLMEIRRIIGEEEIEVEEFSNANIIEVHIGTNCPHGGDTGHGGRTLFHILDRGSTSWDLWADGQLVVGGPNTVSIVLGGDTEATTFADALVYAGMKLKEQLAVRLDRNERG